MACNKFSAYFLSSRSSLNERVACVRTCAPDARRCNPGTSLCAGKPPKSLHYSRRGLDTALDPGPEAIILLAKIKKQPAGVPMPMRQDCSALR